MGKRDEERLAIEYLPYASLKPRKSNPRTHSPEQVEALVASIKRWRWTNPILIDDQNGIVAGHGRLLACQKLGMEEVPCVRLHGLTEAEVRAYVIADNQLPMQAGWDDALLRVEVQGLKADGFDVSLLGFAGTELDKLLDPQAPGGLTEANAVPPLPDKAVTFPGDGWILGKHRLLCGDSRSLEHVAGLMAGTKADMVFTDPPYNVDYDAHGQRKQIAGDSQSPEEFLDFCRKFFAATLSGMKLGAAIYVCHSDRAALQFRRAFEDTGFHFSSMLIWAKDRHTLGRGDYHSQHEPMLYGWPEGKAHTYHGDRNQTTLWSIPRPASSDLHPTQKPVELVARALANSSKEGDAVLDVFGGSGTTLIACEQHGRNAFLMEMEPAYCDVIILRWQDFTGKHAHLESDGRTFTEVMGERTPGKLIRPGEKSEEKKKPRARRIAPQGGAA